MKLIVVMSYGATLVCGLGLCRRRGFPIVLVHFW